MTIQNIFYLGGTTAFVLSSILLIILINAAFRLTKKAKSLIETVEEGMENNVVGTIIQLVPLMTAIFSELTHRRPRRRRKKRR